MKLTLLLPLLLAITACAGVPPQDVALAERACASHGGLVQFDVLADQPHYRKLRADCFEAIVEFHYDSEVLHASAN